MKTALLLTGLFGFLIGLGMFNLSNGWLVNAGGIILMTIAAFLFGIAVIYKVGDKIREFTDRNKFEESKSES